MKKLSYLLVFTFLVSCTSNTIFKKPKDLIPKDTMSMLIQDMMIASSAKFVKNKENQQKVNYMAFVYDKYQIDSLRFQTSNFYYTTEIDLYQEIINDAKRNLEKQQEFYNNLSKEKDSLRRDSIKNSAVILKKRDSTEIPEILLDTTNTAIKKKN